MFFFEPSYEILIPLNPTVIVNTTTELKVLYDRSFNELNHSVVFTFIITRPRDMIY